MFQLEPTAFSELFIVRFFKFEDHRGIFLKPFLKKELGSPFGEIHEVYVSSSIPKTFRGLHYQRGLKAQKKYVICLSGQIEDVAVDLRPGSPTLGRTFRCTLRAEEPVGVIIPAGFAHGIYAYSHATIANFCDKSYSPEDEGGIHHASIPEIADLEVTTLSSKDASLPSLEDVLR
jgi:dTDP-4-dehydrorhamnose 3,5-epimerase